MTNINTYYLLLSHHRIIKFKILNISFNCDFQRQTFSFKEIKLCNFHWNKIRCVIEICIQFTHIFTYIQITF